MKMLVLYRSDFVSRFSDRYVIEELGVREPYMLKKVRTCEQLRRELRDASYSFFVFEIPVLLEQCEPARIEALFAALKGRHVTVLGSAADFAVLPESAMGVISTFFNTGATMNAEAPIYTAAAAAAAEEAGDPYQTLLSQIARGRQYNDLELQKLETHLGLWQTDACVFLLCLDLTGSDEAAAGTVTPALLEQCGGGSFAPPPQRVCFFPKSNAVFFGIVAFRAESYAKRNDYMNAFCANLYAALRRACSPSLCASLGASSACFGRIRLSTQLEEAAAAAFQRVYDGPNRIYHTPASKREPPRPFEKQKYLLELRRAIDNRSEAQVRQALTRLFEQVTAYRLPELPLQGILMEIMSMMYMLCVEENLNITEFNENESESIDFLFLQNIQSVKRENSSFAEHFARILARAAENKKRRAAYSAKIQRVIQYMQENYRANIQLKDLSAMAGVSPNYLCTVFKKETGCKIIEYLNAVRIERARELLRMTDLSAAEISQRIGFSDTAYFCSVFKKVTGRTVSDYRNQPEPAYGAGPLRE